VYGAAADGTPRHEGARTAPQTAYAKCKVLVERDVGALKDRSFAPVFFRNATAFGASPRMRFDLVLNNLAGYAWTEGEVRVTSDGSPWRPLVHIADIAQAVALALEAPDEAVSGEIFNVGDDAQNYRVRDIAEIVAGAFPGTVTSFGAPSADNRSYRVSFAKIRAHLPSFRCAWRAEDGARQLYEIFARIGLTKEVFAATPHTRIEELKRLRRSMQLDQTFRWTPLPNAALRTTVRHRPPPSRFRQRPGRRGPLRPYPAGSRPSSDPQCWSERRGSRAHAASRWRARSARAR